MKRIVIDSIPQNAQSYPTVGDYAEKHDEIRIVVSDLEDEKLEWLIAIHELVEVMLMKHAGIPLQASTEYDVEFEKARSSNIVLDSMPDGTTRVGFMFRGRWYAPDAEPGDAPDSPYREQHNYATAVERMLCAALGVPWSYYTARCNELA